MSKIMNTDTAVLVSSVTRRYKDVVAVDDVSLSIKKGEIYGFLGLNGAGKTTTIRMILGMVKPHEGYINIFGERVQPGRNDIWRRVGYMVETQHAYPDLTVRENLEIVRRLRKLSDRLAVDRIIEQLSLMRDADRKAGKLSLGNGQRLGLAKAMMHQPDLLILDEPANGLDPAGIVEIRNLLSDLAENHGVTIFMSSHILSEVNRLATRIGVVHRGKLIREIDADELAEQEYRRLIIDTRDTVAAASILQTAGIPAKVENDSLVVTDARYMEKPDDVATMLVGGGCPPTRLVVEQADLEAYFLDLVGVDRKAEVEKK